MKKTKYKRAVYIFLAVVIIASTAIIRASATDDIAEKIMNEVVFFGDSTTAHLAVRGGIPKDRVWSGYGSTLLFTSVLERSANVDGEMITIFEAVKRHAPKILVITVGASGGAGFLSEENFKQIYKQLLTGIRSSSPDTIVIAQSILPLSDKSVKYYKKLTKQAVVRANGWIEEVCGESDVPYINSHDLLTDKNGYLKAEYQNDEYLHLTASAYEIILKNLKNYIINNIDKFKSIDV